MPVSEDDFNPFVCQHCGSGNCAYLAGADCPKLLELQDEYYKQCQKLERLFEKYKNRQTHYEYGESTIFQFESEQEWLLFLKELSSFYPGDNWHLLPPYSVEIFFN